MKLLKHKSKIISFMLLFCGLVTMTSCTHSQSAVITSSKNIFVTAVRPAIDEDLATLIPEKLQHASWLNVEKLRSSPVWPTVEALLAAQMSDVLPSQVYEAISRRTSEILIASGHREDNEPDGFVSLFKGTFEGKDILNMIRTAIVHKAIVLGSYDAIQFSNIVVFALTEQTIVIATKEFAEVLIELIESRGISLREDNHFKDFTKPNFGGAVTRYVKGTSQLRIESFRGTPFAQFKWIKNVERMDTTVRISDTIELDVTAQISSAKDSEIIKNSLQHEIQAITSNALIALLGVKPLVNKLQIQTNQNQLSLNWALTETDVKKVVKMVEPIMQIREMLNGK